jgi:branched-chain amino acid transport system substrate-binding protein
MHKAVILLFFCALLAACDSGGGGDGAGAVPGVSDTEIVIGTHQDLSGAAAIIGVAVVNGGRMKFDEVNEAGGVHGRRIRYVVEDAQYQVSRAIQAANKLINRDRVFVMFNAMGTPMNNAVMPMLFERGIPNLFPTTAARSMAQPFRRLQFTSLGTYVEQIKAGMRHFVEAGSAAVPCVIYQDTEFGQEILDGAREQAAAMDLELAALSAHKPTDTEFTAAILRLRNAGCNLTMMGTIHKDTTLILETAYKMGWTDVQWIGTSASYIVAVAELESGSAEGFAVFQPFHPVHRNDPDLDPKIAAWWDRYVERFGIEPDWGAFLGYRDAELLALGLQNAGRELTVESLLGGLESIRDHVDYFGSRVSFGPDDHDAVEEVMLSVVRDGRWQAVPLTVRLDEL